MKKIEIIELENSFLQFFTPAIMIAIGYFLLNLFRFLSFILFIDFYLNSDLPVLIFINMISMLIISLLIYYVFNAKLKVRHLDENENYHYFHNFSKYITLTIIVFCFTFVIQVISKSIMLIILEPVGVSQISDANMIIPESTYFNNQTNTLIYLSYIMVFSPIFLEMIHSRAVIPLLEDRGSYLFYALIISSIGLAFPDLPPNILSENHYTLIPNLIQDFIYGLAIGSVYLITRRIIYPIILVSFLNLYRHIDIINHINFDYQLYNLIGNTFIISLLVTILTILISIFLLNKRKSFPTLFQRCKKKITKVKAKKILFGMIGFSFIALFLLTVQTIAIIIINEISHSTIEYLFYSTLFYVVSFVIPFYFTITTHYVKDY